LAGVGQLGDLQHAEPDVAYAADDDGVPLLNLAAVDGVPGAGGRLDVGGLSGRERLRHLVHDRLLRVERVLGHTADDEVVEAEDGVDLAHPILAVTAKAALATGDDLLRDDAITDLDVVPLGGPFT